MGLTPSEVIETLSEIEKKMGDLQDAWEKAAEEQARLDREWKHRLHTAQARAKGSDAKTREAAAFVIAADQDDLYERLTGCEAGVAKAKTLFNVLDRRASIGQSILRAHTQEGFRPGVQQPAWSGQ